MIEVMITRFGESNGNGNDYWFRVIISQSVSRAKNLF